MHRKVAVFLVLDSLGTRKHHPKKGWHCGYGFSYLGSLPANRDATLQCSVGRGVRSTTAEQSADTFRGGCLSLSRGFFGVGLFCFVLWRQTVRSGDVCRDFWDSVLVWQPR